MTAKVTSAHPLTAAQLKELTANLKSRVGRDVTVAATVDPAILGGLVAIGRASARRLATDFGFGVVFWALPLLLAAIWPQAWCS